MPVLYESGWKRRAALRLAEVMSLVCGAAFLYAGWETMTRYGLHPSEGGALAPLSLRVALGAALGMAGVLSVAGILLFVRFCHVIRIEQAAPGAPVTVFTAGILRPARMIVAPDELRLAGDRQGRPGAAPSYSLRIAGRRLRLIVDLWGERMDDEALGALLRGTPGRHTHAAFRATDR